MPGGQRATGERYGDDVEMQAAAIGVGVQAAVNGVD